MIDATSERLGLNKIAKVLGLKRGLFGFESNRSLAARVVLELGKQNPLAQLFDLSEAEPRRCIREEYTESAKEWTLHYSDGTTEKVAIRDSRH